MLIVGCSNGADTDKNKDDDVAESADVAEQEADDEAEEELEDSSDEELIIGLSIPQVANPYFTSIMKGAEAASEELGYKLVTVDAGYDVAKQVSDMEDFLNQGVSAVIACPIDGNALLSVTENLQNEGIPVFSFAQEIENSTFKYIVDEYAYGQAIGANAAKWINEKLDGKAEVLIISQDNVEAVVRRGDGIQDTIEAECPESTIVARQAGDNPEAGMKIAEDILQQYPDVKVITGNNDSGALGGYEAVKAMGLASDDFYVGGADATPEALAKMKEEGSVYRATIDLFPFDYGYDMVARFHEIKDNVPTEQQDPVYFDTNPIWQEDVLSGDYE